MIAPDSIWYSPRHPLALVLAPLSMLYCAIARLRIWGYTQGLWAQHSPAVPVIVIGNLTVGGTGKTPLTLWLAEWLQHQGWQPGIVTRGYGGQLGHQVALVPTTGDPAVFGDESILLAQRAGCPVMAGRDRVAAARALAAQGCNLVLCDDGLQHYRLVRALEILVIDGQRQFGNERCLPAGPLREPRTRAKTVDLIVINGADAENAHPALHLAPGKLTNLHDATRTCTLEQPFAEPVTAVAGIGHPERFFSLLETHGWQIHRTPYPDHHRFTAQDIARWPAQQPVLMTEKDAVKCRKFATTQHWYLPVSAVPNPQFCTALAELVQQRL